MLTDTKLRSLKSTGRLYRIADSQGLAIEVTTAGSKLWRYRYRFDGKATMAALGEYPAVSLMEARSQRDRMRALLKGGTNPALVRRSEKAARIEQVASTFGAVGLELLAKRSREGLAPQSVRREQRLIEKDLASIRDLPIVEVTALLLLEALRKLEKRGVVETAHRARAHAGRVFRYAIATGRAERNPAVDLSGALENPRTVHLASVTDPVRIGELLRALYAYSGHAATTVALKLAPMVFVRPGELRSARWEDIDLHKAEWRYTTSKTRTPHIVPLAKQAVILLRDLHPLTKRSVFVFPSVRGVSRPMSENTINVALRTMGYDGSTMTGHGFRAMARTVLDEVLGFRPEFIEHQLAHAVRDPLGRAYNRTSHLVERKKMMQAWADYLDSLRLKANPLLES